MAWCTVKQGDKFTFTFRSVRLAGHVERAGK